MSHMRRRFCCTPHMLTHLTPQQCQAASGSRKGAQPASSPRLHRPMRPARRPGSRPPALLPASPSECGKLLRQPFLPKASTAAAQPTASPMLTVEICRGAGAGGRRVWSERGAWGMGYGRSSMRPMHAHCCTTCAQQVPAAAALSQAPSGMAAAGRPLPQPLCLHACRTQAGSRSAAPPIWHLLIRCSHLASAPSAAPIWHSNLIRCSPDS